MTVRVRCRCCGGGCSDYVPFPKINPQGKEAQCVVLGVSAAAAAPDSEPHSPASSASPPGIMRRRCSAGVGESPLPPPGAGAAPTGPATVAAAQQAPHRTQGNGGRQNDGDEQAAGWTIDEVEVSGCCCLCVDGVWAVKIGRGGRIDRYRLRTCDPLLAGAYIHMVTHARTDNDNRSWWAWGASSWGCSAWRAWASRPTAWR